MNSALKYFFLVRPENSIFLKVQATERIILKIESHSNWYFDLNKGSVFKIKSCCNQKTKTREKLQNWILIACRQGFPYIILAYSFWYSDQNGNFCMNRTRLKCGLWWNIRRSESAIITLIGKSTKDKKTDVWKNTMYFAKANTNSKPVNRVIEKTHCKAFFFQVTWFFLTWVCF